MAEKKKQHIIPRCYLQAWCDPNTPAGQLPFIWRISKDGSSKQKRSPKKSFTATDMYTIQLPNGDRNLVIEDTLAKVETDFVAVLAKVRKRRKLDATDRARLCIFSAAHARKNCFYGETLEKTDGPTSRNGRGSGAIKETETRSVVGNGKASSICSQGVCR